MVNTRNAREQGKLSRSASKALKDGSFSRAAVGKKGATSQPPPPKKPTPKGKEPAKEPANGPRVRVWWEPTDDSDRTEFGGMYWPAMFVRKSTGGKIRVRYDNGEENDVKVEFVSPNDLPVEFGEEPKRLEVGEFCEVFNNSPTDPAAWLGRVSKVNKKTYMVDYPFHDSDAEAIKAQHIRRARVWDEAVKTYKFVKPFQTWDDGEVSSPVELEHCTEDELWTILEGAAAAPAAEEAPAAAAAPTPTPAATTPAKATEEATPGAADKPKRGRPRKTEEQKIADRASKKARKAAEAAEAMAAAPPAPSPAAAGVPGLMGALGGIGSVPAAAAGGFPPNLQAIQGLLAQPGMLPLLQTLMAAQAGGAAGIPGFPGIPQIPGQVPQMPGGATAAAAAAVAPAAPTAPAEPPPPPPQLPIPPLPEDEEEEEKEDVPKGATVPPRKARSAYILFSMEFRKTLSREMSFNEATRMAAAKWKEATPDDKKKYDDLANVEREEYVKQQAQYMEYRKKVDEKKAEKAAKMRVRELKIQAHEEAKRKQMEMNTAYLQACAASGVTPVSLPPVPGVPPVAAEPTSAAERMILQLNRLDMEKARKHILKYYHEDAWYMMVDCWRRGSPKLEEALESAKTHVYSKLRADWRGFMIGIFGMEKMTSLARKESDPKPEDEEAAEKEEGAEEDKE